MKKNKKKSTKTSSFGIPGRRSHDSSDFYNSKLYQNFQPEKNVKIVENTIQKDILNQLFCKNSEKMDEIPDNSIHLMITSPPYNVKKDYDEDLTLEEYRILLRNVFSETYRKLVPGGRACINIANIGRKPYLPLHSYIIQDMIEVGFYMRGEIIWNKASSASPSTAWGSWLSASNPVLRDIHEYILVFSKDTFSRKKTRNKKKNTIEKEQFLEWTKSVWTFPAVSARRIGHPAPFPEELPYRLIELYSFENDIVLDPFCGSGTTCLSALKNNRFFIGYDNEIKYIDLANERISKYLMQLDLF
ncbi:MAG: DNA-methyltransferase [Candidatus Zixiibacteriota bacterium]